MGAKSTGPGQTAHAILETTKMHKQMTKQTNSVLNGCDVFTRCTRMKFLFVLILYVPVNSFCNVGTGLPGLNKY